MAAGNYNKGKDSFEINELAALNEDISDDFIDQLQNQLMGSVNTFNKKETNENDDSTLFEEMTPQESQETYEVTVPDVEPEQSQEVSQPAIEIPKAEKKEEISVNTNFDDNFIKKYKAKLNKKNQSFADRQDYSAPEKPQMPEDNGTEPIESISKGNITEKPLSKELKEYNESLDFLDGNVKYSKYVIYIDPQNVDFIEGLTVKERKNLINGILRQQDDIAITKQRFKVMQTFLRQAIIAILTLAISIPVVYTAINASLEATINNHRSAQTNWQTLYKEHGKITPR